MTNRPKCLTCGCEIKFRERFDNPYGEFCSLICFNSNKKEMIERIKKTNQTKYGVDFYPQDSQFIKKQKETKKNKYGDENYNNHKKSKITKKEKYGDENFNNFNEYKLTCLNKYGVDNYSKSSNYQSKIDSQYRSLYPNIDFLNIGKKEVEIKCSLCNSESKLTKQ